MENSSGEVLFEHNAHDPRPPASMIKMLVAYVTMKKVNEGVVNLEDVISASAYASKIGGSQVYLKQGEQFTLQQLLEALMIQSANDAAVAIAEHIGGSPEGFVELMNQQAQELGMNETRVASPHGLPPGKGQEADVTSAYDMALLARAIIRDFPRLHELSGQSEGSFRDGTFGMRNHNDLVRNYPGCDGIKTGYYREAGFCVTATAQRNNVRMIAVTMGCDTKKDRAAETARLLSLGFAQFKALKLVERGAEAGRAVPVKGGATEQVKPVAARDLNVVVKSGEHKKVRQELSLCDGLQAPVAAGTKCGSVAFLLGDRELGRVEYLVKESIPKATLRQRIMRIFR